MSTVRGGTDEYTIAISSGVSADAPSGDILYLNAKDVSPKWKLATKIERHIGRQSFSLKDAKKFWNITISNCKIVSDVASNNVMTELNTIVKYIEDWSDIGHAPAYIFIANRPLNGSFTAMNFRDNIGIDRAYMRGYITSFNPKLEGMVNYVTANITFDECWV